MLGAVSFAGTFAWMMSFAERGRQLRRRHTLKMTHIARTVVSTPAQITDARNQVSFSIRPAYREDMTAPIQMGGGNAFALPIEVASMHESHVQHRARQGGAP